MSYAKLLCDYAKNIKFVYTNKINGWNDHDSCVAISSRKTNTLKDGSIQQIVTFADGKRIKITYAEMQ